MIRHSLKLCLFLGLTVGLAMPASAGFFDRGVKGNGDLTTVTYDLDECDAILLECGLDVTIGFGPRQEIALVMDENLVEYFEIEERGGTLVIDSEKNTRPHKRAHLEVTLKQLKELKIDGAGDIAINDFAGDTFDLVVDGAGDVEVDGQVDVLDVRVNGAGDIDARRLTAREVEVTVNGAGDVSVHASESADVTINGVGDVDVYGKPEHFAKSVHGIGDIDRK